jgi:hypothetical protein
MRQLNQVVDDNEIRQKLADLEELQKSRGWELFMEWCKAKQDSEIYQMTASVDPAVVMKHNGILFAVRQLSSWVAVNVDTLRTQLEKRKGQ